MGATFYTLTADDNFVNETTHLDVPVNNANANKIQLALGLGLNQDNLPYGDLPAHEFTGLAVNALTTTSDTYLQMVLPQLIELGFASTAIEGARVAWA